MNQSISSRALFLKSVKLVLASLLAACSSSSDSPATKSLTLTWHSNPKSEKVTEYRIYVTNCAPELEIPVKVSVPLLDDPNEPRYTFKDFNPRKKCYFFVSAFNGTVESDMSTRLEYAP